MTALEQCMESLITIFHHYAEQDGDKKTLGKKQLKKLLETELPSFLRTQNNPKIMDCIMKDLDQDRDDKMTFEEYLSFIAGLSIACEKCFNCQSQKGKKC